MKKIYFLFLLTLLPLLASAEIVEINGICYDLITKGNSAIVEGVSGDISGSFVLPDKVKYNNKVYHVSSIRNLGSPNITTLTIPEGVTSIGSYGIGCDNLTCVVIPSTLKELGYRAFWGCGSLHSIYISSIESWNEIRFSLDSNPLQYASQLFVNGVEVKDLVIPESITSIQGFSGFRGFTSVTIPNSVYSIGSSAFENCTNLASVTIHSATIIKGCAFSGCSSLSSVLIGNVVSIGSEAFAKCEELTDVYCYSENIPSTDINAFKDSYPEYITLHVPANNVKAYKATEPWSRFKDVVVIAAKVKLNKSKIFLEKGEKEMLNATITPSTLLDKSVIWKSSNTKVATVTSDGEVKGIKAGTATITCTSKVSGSKATCKVTVGYVKLDKSEVTLTKGKTVTLTPTVYPSSLTDKSVTWKSSNTAVATVTTDGKVKGIKAGTATITCISNATGLNTSCQVVVVNGTIKLSKSEIALLKDKTVTLKATLTPSTLSDKSVTWKSSNTKVATVTGDGKVTAVKNGTATITCTSAALGLSATCKVTVGKVTLDKSEMIMRKGKTEVLTATVYPTSLADKSVTWQSSDTEVATVTSTGKVKGIKDGTVTITCTSNATGLKATCKVKVVTGNITLNMSETVIEKGNTVTLKAKVTPTTLTDKSVTWVSSNTKVATVTSDGKVKGVKYGTATITCTSNATGLSATCKVTVGKVVISESDVTIKKSRTTQLTATIYPSSLEDKSVIWESSNTAVATVSSDGKVKGIMAGTVTITCTSVATGLSGTCTVTVLATSESRSTDGNDDNVTGIKDLEENSVATEPYDVYDLNGRKVLNQTTSLDGLPNGIYIVNGKKMLKK